MNFVQAMIVPTMVTLGVGSLLVAQNLSLMEVSYAAPAAAPGAANPAETASGPAGGAKPTAGGKGKKGGGTAAKPDGEPGPTATAAPGQVSPPGGGTNSPEFGGRGPDGTVIRAITDQELTIKAIESSGREDPFMALVPPAPEAIVPPKIDLGPIVVPTVQPPPPTPKPTAVPTPVPSPPAPVKPPVVGGNPVPRPTVDVAKLPLAGDRLPPINEPQWLIRGIISTGLERVCLLEGKDEQVHGRVGDKLSDGSVIESISNRGVTFLRSGRRFVKEIGG